MDLYFKIENLSAEDILLYVDDIDINTIINIQNLELKHKKSFLGEIMRKDYDLFISVVDKLKVKMSKVNFDIILHNTLNAKIPMDFHPIGVCYLTHGIGRCELIINKYYNSNMWFLQLNWINLPCISIQEAYRIANISKLQYKNLFN